MAFPNDNRIILALGAVLAVVAAVVIALVFMGRGGDEPAPEPEERAGLQLDVTEAPDLEPTRELRCFVDGQFVGMATLADCARQNGVATEGLDVGLDETGALAAAPTAVFAPPPEEPPLELTEADPINPPSVTPTQPAPQPVQAGAACLRHVGGEWRQLSSGMSQGACVQALFAGTCVRPGDAQYGRWGDTTLRLVPRRVEQSQDNSRFRTLAEQDRNCQFPGLR
ncbi:MAG: hypothetical protein ACI8U3_001699 [Brevundimonas sp.]|jgi:hypothetical protein|uniref:hypothetical protein n=1 Tax=Brevundimonas sp. TaxID=1871086 RepID=UPI0039E25C28